MTRGPGASWVAVAVAVGVLLAGRAEAGGKAKVKADEIRDYLDEATSAFALNHFADAAENYEKALALKPDAAVLYNAAQARRLAGNKQRALELYQSYVRLYGTDKHAEVDRHIEDLKQAIAQDRALASSAPTVPAPAGGAAARPVPLATSSPAAAPAGAPSAVGSMAPAAFTVSPAASAGPGSLGSLAISTSAPAVISVDGGEVGAAPVHIRDLPAGVHVVAARFDGGDEARKKVRVGAGDAIVIVVDPPPSAQAGVWRRGYHLGPAVSAEMVGLKEDFHAAGPGIAPELVLNIGVSPALDVRLGGRLLLAHATNGVIVVAGVPVSARFNLGSVFSLGIGAFAGVSSAYKKAYDMTIDIYPRETGLVAGIEAFPAIFRFGVKREIELAVGGGYLYHLTTENDVIHFGVNVTYLFL